VGEKRSSVALEKGEEEEEMKNGYVHVMPRTSMIIPKLYTEGDKKFLGSEEELLSSQRGEGGNRNFSAGWKKEVGLTLLSARKNERVGEDSVASQRKGGVRRKTLGCH